MFRFHWSTKMDHQMTGMSSNLTHIVHSDSSHMDRYTPTVCIMTHTVQHFA